MREAVFKASPISARVARGVPSDFLQPALELLRWGKCLHGALSWDDTSFT
jgi:hypothetical protein